MTGPRQPRLHRRTVAGAATLGLALPVLAACSGGAGGTVSTNPNTPTPRSAPTAAEPTDATPSESGGGADAFARTSDIQPGGGTIFPDQQLVITQPSTGEFKCFTAVCTHQGCVVSSVSDGLINCDCHGSAFSIEDGSVVNGPATQPLAQEPISVRGEAITLG